jgi:hypothetical protein
MGIKKTILPYIVFAVGMGGAFVGLAHAVLDDRGGLHRVRGAGQALRRVGALHDDHLRAGRAARGVRGAHRHAHAQRAPRWNHPLFSSDRVPGTSHGRFIIGIEATDKSFDPEATRRSCSRRRAAPRSRSSRRTDRGGRRMTTPRRVHPPRTGPTMTHDGSADGVGPAALAGSRAAGASAPTRTRAGSSPTWTSSRSGIPQESTGFFADGRTARPLPEHAVAFAFGDSTSPRTATRTGPGLHGRAGSMLKEDDAVYTGKFNNEASRGSSRVDTIPVAVTARDDRPRARTVQHLLRRLPRLHGRWQGHGRHPLELPAREPDWASSTATARTEAGQGRLSST